MKALEIIVSENAMRETFYAVILCPRKNTNGRWVSKAERIKLFKKHDDAIMESGQACKRDCEKSDYDPPHHGIKPITIIWGQQEADYARL